MMHRREICLLGLIFGLCSLAFCQDNPVTPAPGAAVTQPAAEAQPTTGEQPAAGEQPTAGEQPAGDEQPEEVQPAKPQDLAVVYNGEAALPQQIVMGDWGFVQHEPNFTFAPVHLGLVTNALIIASYGRYQGTRFDFVQPLNAADLLGAKNVYLELYIRAVPGDNGAAAKTPATKTPTTPRPMGPMGPMGPMSPYGPMGPMGMPGAMNPNFPGGTMPQASQGEDFPPEMAKKPLTVPMPTLQNLRFTFFTEKGATVVSVPADDFFPKEEIDRQWIRIGIPLDHISPLTPIGGKLLSMVISSDNPTAFYANRIAFVRDDAPMTMEAFIYPPFLQAGNRIFFQARVKSGLARYAVSWEFAKGNNATTTVKGDRVIYTYDKEGSYTVKCTVRDLSGDKETLSKTVTLKISSAENE